MRAAHVDLLAKMGYSADEEDMQWEEENLAERVGGMTYRLDALHKALVTLSSQLNHDVLKQLAELREQNTEIKPDSNLRADETVTYNSGRLVELVRRLNESAAVCYSKACGL